MTKPATYRYKWTGEHRVVFTAHQRPDGSTVEVDPGEEFETTTPVNTKHVPLAVSLDEKSEPIKNAAPAKPEA
jgi:hypothetical protein